MRSLSLAGRIWSGAASVAAPGLRLLLRRRVLRGKEIAARLPEREGIEVMPRPSGRLLWVHAASVGESQSVLPLLERLVLAPGLTVLMTTGTVTSAALLAERLPALGPGRVLHRFVPLDVPAWAARFLDHWRPDAAAFVESELWPNLLAACGRRGIGLMLVNGRMSARSARGWARVGGSARRVLGGFDRVHARSAVDAERLQSLGAPRATLVGDLKFAAAALAVDEGELGRLRGVIGERPVWLAASTHAGEEAVAADVHRALVGKYPDLLTIVVPRHPERGVALAAELGAARRGAGEGPAEAGLWIVDTIGEMGLAYRLAPVVFVGRSLVRDGGGQNPLEPARLGCAIAMGPHRANFEGAVRLLQEAGALATVADAADLAIWVVRMLDDPGKRMALGRAAVAAAAGEADLPERVACSLLELLERG